MALGLLTKLASFSTKNPKTVLSIVGVLVVVGFGVHYKMLIGERDKLRVATTAYESAVEAFEAREASLQADLALAQAAAAQALQDRREARRALDAFRAGREGDVEAMEWASQQLPIGEIERLCAALPDMEGC
jgi:hypothetical protein